MGYHATVIRKYRFGQVGEWVGWFLLWSGRLPQGPVANVPDTGSAQGSGVGGVFKNLDILRSPHCSIPQIIMVQEGE